MASKYDVYDIGNYFKYNPDLGIYDYNEKDNELLEKLKLLTYDKKVVVNNELLDSVSHKVYGNEKLWWVLALYNDIIDPLNPGSIEISVPLIYDVEDLLIDLLEKKRGLS